MTHLQRVLRWLCIAAWVVAMISWLPLWQIEGAALHQPAKPTGVYSVPMHVKSAVRYVTPNQKFTDHLAQMTFAGGVATFLIAGMISEWLKRRQNSK